MATRQEANQGASHGYKEGSQSGCLTHGMGRLSAKVLNRTSVPHASHRVRLRI